MADFDRTRRARSAGVDRELRLCVVPHRSRLPRLPRRIGGKRFCADCSGNVVEEEGAQEWCSRARREAVRDIPRPRGLERVRRDRPLPVDGRSLVGVCGRARSAGGTMNARPPSRQPGGR